jgi:23S rRNA pseudouridine1911/1915/1917 synthase
MMTAPWRELIVDERGHAVRLDSYLAKAIAGLSRRRAQALADAGDVTVNGRRARKGDELRAGDAIAVWSRPVPPRWPPRPAPEIDLAVVREEASFLAVDKPSGIPSVPLDPGEPGTLAGAVAARFPECAALGRSPGDGGLLQRLDRGTSGLVLVARSEVAYRALSAAQRCGDVEKTYLALVARREAPWPERIDAPLDGAPATTWIRSAEGAGAFCLLEAVIHRGRRHQIRAHLAHLGAPIAGDARFGGPAAPGLERLFLHARSIRAPHPETGAPFAAEAPLRAELARVLSALGGGR